MTQGQAFAAFATAVALIVAGLVWLFGPYGLIGSGVALAAFLLFVVEIRGERPRDHTVESPTRTLSVRR